MTKFIVELVFEDGKSVYLARNKGSTTDKTKALHFKFVPYWRDIYNRYYPTPKKVIISEVEP